ncbi:DUF2637 domain-containing protein [Streptomyces halobius]|uniref:DUF2637 domain-containing protein n=1 Tax=Streptomyces halobius TaxID=2879846 RepID=A0ABY4MAW8_9ACTN|nr:DUF2637 domain-containing protein [Streptomyces halobius]UQA94552.1 DUF2637 domain-containing protein [Streptomyces halobius]
MTEQTAERYALVAAGAVIVALTAGAFWLSYAHLAEVAGQHGLKSSPIRQWAWPATLDAFIVAGELLMLRAGLRRVTDGWAIGLTATGSIGSIVLNVAGVSGRGTASTVPLLDYVVAAVPPTAALLAFGVLMRQIHQLVDRPTARLDPASIQAPISPVNAAFQQPAPVKDRHHGDRAAEHPDPDCLAVVPVPRSAETTSAPEPTGERPRRAGRPQDISDDEIRAIAREVMARKGTASPTEVGDEIRNNRRRKVSNARVKKVCDELSAEKAEPGNGPTSGSSTG